MFNINARCSETLFIREEQLKILLVRQIVESKDLFKEERAYIDEGKNQQCASC
jgi:hypothetical protein